ncbi:MAG: maleylpyruvate isomerase family mycothiol-dependent enzyme, partial [Actinobacteria bacterium]|nr:maleylpyruvate isomerase family mycothiol-dependent enzyme [Actinomycetota bacterium]
MSRVAAELEAYLDQCVALADWAAGLPDDAFAAPSALPGWDLRTLIGHVVGSKDGLQGALAKQGSGAALRPADYVRAYAPAAADISRVTAEVTGDQSPAQLLDQLRRRFPVPDGVDDLSVVAGPRGPMSALDFTRTRTLDLVVHCDDATRSRPDGEPVPLLRPALASTVRLLAEILATQAPGRSVEVRVPPFVAVQAVEGPRHTRGTPPNVVETDPVTWLRVSTGRETFAAATAGGRIRASGGRADLTPYLPVL